jgi:N-formylglutamate amidohydrolase
MELAPQEGFASFSVPPANTTLPAISGTPHAGQTLACSTGTWSGSTPQTDAYAWLREGTPIAGATTNHYTVTTTDTGHQLRCRVTASNLAGSASAQSAPLTIT